MSNEPSGDNSCSPFGPDNVVRCFAHGLPAALKTSSTTSTPDRKFYCCSVPSGDPQRCSFFYWQDELARTPSHHIAGAPDNKGSMEQTISPLCRDTRPNAVDDDVNLTPSQKRMRIIEAALSQVNSPSASPNVDVRQTAGAPASSYQAPLTPVKPSRASEDNVQFPSIQESNTAMKGKCQALPQDHTSGEDEWDMITPPPTNPPHRLQECRNLGRSLFPDEPPSPTPVSRFTSKNPKAATSSGLSDWDACTSSPALGEPYDLPKVSRKLGFNLLPSALSDDSTAEVFEELAQNAHLFSPRLGSVLNELPDFWRAYKKSERKRIASEKSVAAKSKRITTLNNEVAKLKAKIEELESEKLTH